MPKWYLVLENYNRYPLSDVICITAVRLLLLAWYKKNRKMIVWIIQLLTERQGSRDISLFVLFGMCVLC